MFKSFVSAFLLLLVLAVQPAQSAITIEQLFKPDQVELGSVQIAPDGKHFAMIIPQEDRSYLAIFDANTMKATSIIKTQQNEFISTYWWVSSNRVVAALAQRFGGRDTPVATGELVGANVDGSKNKYLFGYRGSEGTGTRIKKNNVMNASAEVLEPIADEKNRVLIGISTWNDTAEQSFMKLAYMHVETGSLSSGEGKSPVRYFTSALTDHAGKLTLLSGTDAELNPRVFYKAAKGSGWEVINEWVKNEEMLSPLAYTRDGKHIYARVTKFGSLDALVKMNLANGERKTIYTSEQADFGEVYLTADKKDIYAIKDNTERGGYIFLDEKLPEAQLTRKLMEQFPGELVVLTSFSDDGNHAVVFKYSDLNPGNYLLYNRQNGKIRALVDLRPGLNQDDLASMEPISLKARDGLQLHGWLSKPYEATGVVPMVVMVHGGPYNVLDHWGFNKEVQLFTSRGFSVLQINFRGSDGYGLDFAEAGRKQWGEAMQDDVTDATQWAIKNGHADAKRICIYGISYGAYAAMMGAVKEPDLYQCAIGYSGVYDLKLRTTKGDTDDSGYGRSYLEEYVQQDPTEQAKNSPALRAAEIKAAVLLIHGGKDHRTPVAHAHAMRKGLDKAKKPHEWLYKSTEGHGFYATENQIEAYETILAFLKKHIGDASTKKAEAVKSN